MVAGRRIVAEFPRGTGLALSFFITSPIMVFAYRGYYLSKNRISIADMTKQIAILFLMTVGFGAIGRVIAFIAKTV